MDVRTYLRAIRRSWWIILIVVVLGAGGGFVYSKRSTPVYAAHLSFTVAVAAGTNSNVQSSDQYAQGKAVTYAELLSKDVAASAVIRDTGLKLTDAELVGEISASAALNTTIINATVMDTSAARALRIAQSLARTFPAAAIGTEPAANRAIISLNVVTFPHVGLSPVLPRTKVNTVLGFAAGLLLGLLIAVLRFLRDTSVRTREDLERIAHAPVVGDISYDSAARNAPLVLERQARSVRAEAYRQLRTNLQFIDAAGALRVVVVTSSTESEGKSSTATNLALMLAETGRSVLLVGADLRRPRVAQYLGLESAIGLTNVLVNQVSLQDALQPWGADGMVVLASGSVPPNPSELLGSPRMGELLAELRDRFEVVIIDTPPLLPVTDAAVLAVHADGVVVVCRHGRTRRAQLATAVRALESVNARIVGTVLNMRPARGPESGQYGGYGYYEEAGTGSRLRLVVRRVLRRSDHAPDAGDSALPTVERFTVPEAVEHLTVPEAVERTDISEAQVEPEVESGVAASAHSPRHVRPPTFDELVGAPARAAELSTGALAALERRQGSARRGRTAQLIEAVATLPDTEVAAPRSSVATAVPESVHANGRHVNGATRATVNGATHDDGSAVEVTGRDVVRT